MNTKNINILILEDNPTDAELMIRELKKSGFTFEWERVETEKAFKEALSKKPDIILSDYKLPSFDGMSAIKLQQQIVPEIPLILVSGTIGEELAVECLKAGAMDYILKDRLSLLGHSVKRAIKEAEEHNKLKQAEQTLKESEKKYRQLAETAKDVIMVLDLKGNVKYINQEGIKLSGYSKEELFKMNVNDVLSADKLPISDNNFAKRIAGDKSIFLYEIDFFNKKGEKIPVEIKSSLIAEQGKPIGILIIARDITKQKRIEEELARIAAEQKNIMGTISDGIYMLDMSGNLVNWNKVAETVSGLSAKELMDKPAVELFAKEDRTAVAEAITKGLKEGIGEVTASFLRKGRSPAIYQWSTVPLKDPQDKVIGLTGVGRDITEQKRIEEELARIAAEQKNIMGTISDGIYMLDMSGNLVNWNRAAEVVSGLSAKELMDKPIVELFAKEDRTAVAEAITKGLKEGIGEVTASFLRKGRTPAIYQWSTVPLKDPHGKVIGLTGVGRDITERKRAEKALRESETQIRTIYEAAKNVSFIMTGLAGTDAHILEFSPGAEAIFGYRGEEVIGKPVSILHLPEDVAKFPEVIESMRQRKAGFIGESTLVRKSGEKFPAIFTTYPLFDVEGKITAALGVSIDITERRKATEALRISEAQKRAILDGITTNIAFVNKNLEILWVNKASAISVGKLPEEMIGYKCYELWADPEKPCDGCPTLKAWKTRKSEHAIMTTTDGRIWDERGEPVFDQDGELIGMVEIAQDITERKRTEEALRRVTNEQAILLNRAPAMIFWIDKKGNFIRVNEAFAAALNKSPDDVNGKSLFDLYPEDMARKFHGDNLKVMESGIPKKHIEEPVKTPDGIMWVSTDKIPYRDENGGIIGIIAFSVDITHRKQAEEALNKNLQQQKLLTKVSYLFTKLGKFDENINEAIRLIGEYSGVSRVYIFENFNTGEYTKNTYEWCNRNIEPQIDNLQETPYSIVPSWKKILNEKGMVYSTNISELPQDLIDILEPQKIKSILVLPIYVKDQFFGFMGFDECENHRVWDNSEIDFLKTVANVISTIFERRQAEEKYVMMFEMAKDAVFMSDENGKLVDVNQMACESLGYSKEELLKLSNKDIDADPRGYEAFLKIRDEMDEQITFEVDQQRKDGTLLPMEITGSSFNSGGKRIYLAIARDITERKQAEKSLEQAMKIFNRLCLILQLLFGKQTLETTELMKILIAHPLLTNYWDCLQEQLKTTGINISAI